MREHILVGYLQKNLDEVTSRFNKQLNFLVLWYGVPGMYTKGSCCTKSLHFTHTKKKLHGNNNYQDDTNPYFLKRDWKIYFLRFNWVVIISGVNGPGCLLWNIFD